MSFLFSQTNSSKTGRAGVDVPLGMFAGTAYKQGFHDNALASLYRMSEYQAAKSTDPSLNPIFKKEHANHEAQQLGLDLVFDNDTSADEFNLLVRRKEAERRRQTILGLGATGGGRIAGAFGMQMLGSISNPTDFALMFLPVVGSGGKTAAAASGASAITKARVGFNNMWKRGILTSEESMRKVGVPLTPIVASAIDGSVGQAVTEVPLIISSYQDQTDYTIKDAGIAVAFGAAFGATFRGALETAAKVHRGLSARTKQVMIDTAKEDFLAGEEINPGRVLTVDEDIKNPLAVDDPEYGTAREEQLSFDDFLEEEKNLRAKKKADAEAEIDDGNTLAPEKLERNNYGDSLTEDEIVAFEDEIDEIENMLRVEFGEDPDDPFSMRLDDVSGLFPSGQRLVHRSSKRGAKELLDEPMFFTLREDGDGESPYTAYFGDASVIFELDGNEEDIVIDTIDLYFSMAKKNGLTDVPKLKDVTNKLLADPQTVDDLSEALVSTGYVTRDDFDLRNLDKIYDEENESLPDAFIDAANDARTPIPDQMIVDALKGFATRNPEVWAEIYKDIPLVAVDATKLGQRLKQPLTDNKVTRDIAYHRDRDTAHYKAHGETPSMEEFMSMVESDLPMLQPFFDRLRDMEPDLNSIKIKFVDDLASTRKATGEYDGRTDTISLNKSFTHKTFVHEVVHSITVRRTRKLMIDVATKEGLSPFGIAAARGENYADMLQWFAGKTQDTPIGRLTSHYLTALKAFEKQTGIDLSPVLNGDHKKFMDYGLEAPHYGLYDLDEFIAEAISNPTFQKFLNNIPSDTPNKSLWISFIDLMRDIFMIAKRETNTLLDDVLTEYAQIPVMGVRMPEISLAKLNNADIKIPRVKDAAAQITPGTTGAVVKCLLKHAT